MWFGEDGGGEETEVLGDVADADDFCGWWDGLELDVLAGRFLVNVSIDLFVSFSLSEIEEGERLTAKLGVNMGNW